LPRDGAGPATGPAWDTRPASSSGFVSSEPGSLVTLTARLDAFAAAITEARDIAAAGGVLELTGLDQAAGEICAAVSAVPRDERRGAAERLAQIGVSLDALASALSAQNERAQEGPGSRQSRAGRAYGSATAGNGR